MLSYVIRRLVWVVVLVFLVSAVTFLIFYALPSADPAKLRAGKQPTAALIKSIRHQLGLDKSLPEQYRVYMAKAMPFDLHHGGFPWINFKTPDLGYSYQNSQPVLREIGQRLPATISLTVGAVIVWLLVGLPTGIISAVKRRSILDRATMTGALVAISAPVYWLGLVGLYFFSNDIGKVHIFDGAGSYTPISDNVSHWFGSLLLPWIVLAASFAAFYARLLRSNMLEVMTEDYIRTARAKGLPERRVIMRHALRSAITPIVTVLGLDIGILLGGALLTERVFNIPGIGLYAYQGISNADLTVVQGTVLLATFFIVFANLLVDLVYAVLDPRVRYS
jgi:peptide/nickel transport system permease protein